MPTNSYIAKREQTISTKGLWESSLMNKQRLEVERMVYEIMDNCHLSEDSFP